MSPRSLPSLLCSSLLLALAGEACLLLPTRHLSVVSFRQFMLLPPDDPANENCLIDVCYLGLDHPALCEDILSALRSRDAMEPCNDTCAANATGWECRHPTVTRYLLDQYDGLSCGEQWESIFWSGSTAAATTTDTTAQPFLMSASTLAANHKRFQPSFRPNLLVDPSVVRVHLLKPGIASLDAANNTYFHIISQDLTSSDFEAKHKSPSPIRNSSGKTRNFQARSAKVLWLLLHGKGPVFRPAENINDPWRHLSYAGLRGNDPALARLAKGNIQGQHFEPSGFLATSATHNPPATHHRPRTRDQGGDEALTPKADEAADQHLQRHPLTDNTNASSARKKADHLTNADHRGTAKTEVMTQERGKTKLRGVSKLSFDDKQITTHDELPLISGGIPESPRGKMLRSEVESRRKNLEAITGNMKQESFQELNKTRRKEETLKEPNTERDTVSSKEKNTIHKKDGRERKLRRPEQEKSSSYTTRIIVKSIHKAPLENSGFSVVMWLVVAFLCVVVAVAACCGLVIFARLALNHVRKCSINLS